MKHIDIVMNKINNIDEISIITIELRLLPLNNDMFAIFIPELEYSILETIFVCVRVYTRTHTQTHKATLSHVHVRGHLAEFSAVIFLVSATRLYSFPVPTPTPDFLVAASVVVFKCK